MREETERRNKPIGIIEAVETLSSLADLNPETDIGLVREHQLSVQGEGIYYQTVHWLSTTTPSDLVSQMQDIFKVVLRYLKDFYQTEYERLSDPSAIDEIKTVMVLVGEAAHKVDKVTSTIFSTCAKITELHEFKNLQEFYKNKIAKRIGEDHLQKWVAGLAQQAGDRRATIELRGRKKVSSKNVFVDLDSVKKDLNYELFFLRKENGTRYFNANLIRNIKLVCDFGTFFDPSSAVDSLAQIDEETDYGIHLAAVQLLGKSARVVEEFFKESGKRKKGSLAEILRKACMALMLAANPRNLLKNKPAKASSAYFADFQLFLREALASSRYQKMVAYPSSNLDEHRWIEMRLIQLFCRLLYHDLRGLESHHALLEQWVQTAASKKETTTNSLGEELNQRANNLKEAISNHPQGPLRKALKLLETYGDTHFDTLEQQNLPDYNYSILLPRQKVDCLRLPSPTHQEFIHKATIFPEFYNFLHSYLHGHSKEHHLLINLQDRTSWSEHVRSVVLEEFGKKLQKGKNCALTVVTLAKDTDFYHQSDAYHNVNQAEEFMDLFEEQLESGLGGFYFSSEIKQAVIGKWSKMAMKAIHEIFFQGKNVLTRSARCVFIELFYLLLTLKLIEVTKASSFSFTCKDGVDVGPAASALMPVFVSLVNGVKWTPFDRENLDVVLFAPALFMRERMIHLDRLDRTVAAINHIENCVKEDGEAGFKKNVQKLDKLFDSPLSNCSTSWT